MNNVGKPALYVRPAIFKNKHTIAAFGDVEGYGLIPPTVGTFFIENHLSNRVSKILNFCT
jgi:hypothetical protein